MAAIDEVLRASRPASVAEARASWPVRSGYHPSPADWRDECLYFLLPDRFSDETPAGRPLLDRARLGDARGGSPAWRDGDWQNWARSGRVRFQGGTLRGVRSRLGYLAGLGVTALWIGPPWKQRQESFVNSDGELADEYHGYAIQDFFEIDPRFGTRQDLVELVGAAHEKGIRVVLDIVLNHTARNWLYRVDGQLRPLTDDPEYHPGVVYEFGAWLDGTGEPLRAGAAPGPDDAVWPQDLQPPDAYHRRGQIQDYDDFSNGQPNLDDDAQLRLADMTNRDLALSAAIPGGETPLQVMIACWTYWLSLTDCDGFRIDTLKHITLEEARIFCGALREYAETLGKRNFLLAGEVAGGLTLEQLYLGALRSNLSATLELGDARQQLRTAALGGDGGDILDRYAGPDDPLPGSHRAAGSYFVTSIDDHDDVGVALQRFPSLDPLPGPYHDDAVASFFEPLQTVTGSAVLLLTLGIPCLYYGAEQGLAAAALGDPGDRLPFWRDRAAGRPHDHGNDRYLREAMFGPEHPRRPGGGGRPAVPGGPAPDPDQPGFGPFGTTGHHVFDPASPQYRRLQTLLAARATHAALRLGRQYARPVTEPGADPVSGNRVPGALGWSRLLAWQELVVVVNTRRSAPAGEATVTAQILVDATLNPDQARFRVVASTAQCDGLAGHLDAGAPVEVQAKPGGPAALVVTNLPPGEIVVLARDALTP
jgi:glycosidase